MSVKHKPLQNKYLHRFKCYLVFILLFFIIIFSPKSLRGNELGLPGAELLILSSKKPPHFLHE